MLNTSRDTEPEIANAVHEDRAGAVEATHEHGVAGVGVAVFPEEEGAHAGRVAQRFGERRRALVANDLFLDHLDGLRRVQQRGRELGVGRRVGLVVGDDGRVLHAHFRQRIGRLGEGGRGGDGHQRRGGGAGQMWNGARNGVFAALDVGHEVFSGRGGD
jgi:hypothetical protein